MIIQAISYRSHRAAVIISVFLCGCVSIPEAIKGTTATPQQDFISVHKSPNLFKGQEARFGGRVVSVGNQPHITRLEITSMSLDSSAQPILSTPSLGRFVAYVNKFLDPVDYRGHFVTVVGTISGAEAGKIGEASYNFVVVNVIGLQRWHTYQQVVYPLGPTVWMRPWDNQPYWNVPGWGWGRFGDPVQVQTILTK